MTSSVLTWLFLLLLGYGMLSLYWAGKGAAFNTNLSDYFIASGTLAPWMTAVGIAGVSVSGWFVLGFPPTIASQGFGFAVLNLGAILIPLTGVLFLKPQWALAKRHQLHSQAAMLNFYFDGRAIGVISALIAVLFAVAFCGLQLRAVSVLLAKLSGYPEHFPLFVWGISAFLLAYVVIGGMRAVGFLSVIQTMLSALAILVLGIFILTASGGFAALSQRLAVIAADPNFSAKGMFEVAGVIQFTSGLGVEAPIGSQWTAMMISSTALALLGIQASPMVTHVMLSTRSAKAIAAGQTWIMAAFFGALLVFLIILIGASGIGRQGDVLDNLMSSLSRQSPWFTAIIAIGLVGAVQAVAGLALLAAANTFIRDIYKPFFHAGISDKDQILFGRVNILIMLVASALLASFAPVALSALGSVALPIAFQLWPALLGLCWFRFISRQAAMVGLGLGIFAVLCTETLGISILEFLGLDLPWGRWPWTIHSAAWGMFVNLLAVIVISAITQGRGHSAQAHNMSQFQRDYVRPNIDGRALRPAAWSAVLAWMFFAVGPGVILGNHIFGSPTGGFEGWVVGMPSIWAWTLLFWVLGVFLIWFMSYKIGLATMKNSDFAVLAPTVHMPARSNKIQEMEMLRLAWSVFAIAAVITVTSWIFN